jgi:putative ABC transport system permease protein
VAAFLLNVVMSRIVSVQRGQLAALKAMGYTNAAVAAHYAKLGLAVALAGTAVGVAAGAYFGSGMTRMYTMFFHFPILLYRLRSAIVAQAVGLSAASAVLGTLG